IALLLIDIDHFKKFNDTYGHQTGDFILVEFARVLEKNLRKYDILSRYGGEEFVILLPDTDAETGMLVGEKLRSIIEEHTFTENDTEYHVTASFGVSAGRPTAEDNFSKGDFIGQADSALYSAKEAGRNQVALYTSAKKKKWFSF
ncbi:MAG: GGDEF domain-containing protein, partial [Acidobacteria bacterium]